jgi:uncharacterized membrane protein YedE/YeeE
MRQLSSCISNIPYISDCTYKVNNVALQYVTVFVNTIRSFMLETEFTPIASLLGGALIGLSAVILMTSHGRVAGISGIVSRLLPPAVDTKGLPQGLTFIAGLLLAAPLWFGLAGQAPVVAISSNMALLGLAGVLVGFGSVLGNGCTSGHGVCGISRMSGRSMVATVTFMATGAITVFVLRHVLGG